MFSLMFLLLVICVIPPLASLFHAFQDVFLFMFSLMLLLHVIFVMPLLVHGFYVMFIPPTNSPMAPSHDVPLACASW
jgi:hypothetical protein